MTEGAFLHSAEAKGRILEKIQPLAEYGSRSCMPNSKRLRLWPNTLAFGRPLHYAFLEKACMENRREEYIKNEECSEST